MIVPPSTTLHLISIWVFNNFPQTFHALSAAFETTALANIL